MVIDFGGVFLIFNIMEYFSLMKWFNFVIDKLTKRWGDKSHQLPGVLLVTRQGLRLPVTLVSSGLYAFSLLARKVKLLIGNSVKGISLFHFRPAGLSFILMGWLLFMPFQVNALPSGNVSLDFNGTNHLDCGGATGVLDLTDALTIEAWVKPNSKSTISTIVGKRKTGGSNPGYGLFINTWNTSDRRIIFETKYVTTETSDNTVTWGQWQHIAVSSSGSSAQIYVDGIAKTSTGSVAMVSDTSEPLLIGSLETFYEFSGEIAEVRIWNVARSQTEIQNNMNTVFTGNETSLIGLWNIEEGTGTTTNDKTANNNCSFNGNPTWIGSSSNNPPVITQGSSTSISMSEDGSPTPFSLTLNASDTDSDTLTWSISTQANNGTASASGTGTSKNISYNPSSNYYGSDSFVVKVDDGNGETDTITVNVNITTINDAPTLTSFSSSIDTTEEDTEVELTFAELAAQGDEVDTDGTVVSFIVQAVSTGTLNIGTSSSTATAYASGTNDTIDSSNNAYWTPAASEIGALNAFTVIVKDDGDALSSTAVQAIVTVIAAPTYPNLSGASETFDFPDNGASNYWVQIGSNAGRSDIYDSGQIDGTATSENVTDLPTDGSDVYVRIWNKKDGKWAYEDQHFMAFDDGGSSSGTPPPISSHTAGDTLSATETFSWSDTGASNYWVQIGSSEGSNDIHDSGQLDGTATSENVTGLPIDGSDVFVRIWSKNEGKWAHEDHQFTADNSGGAGEGSTVLTISSHTTGETLSASETFTWTDNGASNYWLMIGASAGRSDHYDSGVLADDVFSQTVPNLPTDGSQVYVRVWHKSNGKWESIDDNYMATNVPGGDSTVPGMTTPSVGTALTSATQTFTWNASGATKFWLHVGTSASRSDIHDSGEITVASDEVSGLPTDGSAIYVRIWSFGDKWKSQDFIYNQE